MAGSLFDWSTTAGDNDDSDSDINWIEGQAGATVNNSARAMMAKIAGLVRALKGSYTTAGSSTAYTLTVDFPPSSLASKGWFGLIRFHTANGATPSIDINSLGAVAIYMNDGAAPAVGELAEDSVHFVHYDTETSRLRVLTSGAGSLSSDDISDFDSAVAALIVTIDEMTAETAPAVNDYLGIYDASATAQRKMTFENFLKVINSLTEDTTPDMTNDFAMTYDASASGVKKVALTNIAGVLGQQTIWVPASAMASRTTNGAASGTSETSTNKVMLKTLDFDTSTAEYAQFAIQMPKGWDESTLVCQFIWSHASTTTNFGVAWEIAAVAFADDDAADTAFGTAVTVTDTGGTTNDIYISAESSALTVAGSPAAEEYVVFQINRAPSNGSDTMAIDARLHGVKIHYTISAAKDD